MATGDESGSTLERFILLKFDQLVDLAEGLDNEAVNQVPTTPGGNSVAQILTHCCGMMRRWSSTVALGDEVPRDRDAEFEVVATVAELREVAADTRSNFIADVAMLDPVKAPAALPDDEDRFWASTNVGILLHVFEELCQHLGHAEMVRDIVDNSTSEEDRS